MNTGNKKRLEALHVPSFSSSDVWRSGRLPTGAALVDYAPEELRSNDTGRAFHLLELRGPTLLLAKGIVLTLTPPATVVDVAGGCCRKPHGYNWKSPIPVTLIPAVSQFASYPSLLRTLDESNATVYPELFNAMSAPSLMAHALLTQLHALATVLAH